MASVLATLLYLFAQYSLQAHSAVTEVGLWKMLTLLLTVTALFTSRWIFLGTHSCLSSPLNRRSGVLAGDF